MPGDDEKGDAAGRLSRETINRVKESILGVGYRQPPRHTRFAKGQSGNPAGRPRRSDPDVGLRDQPLLQAALEGSRRKTKIREGENIREVTFSEAMLEALKVQGLKGNARSAGMWLDITRAAHILHARERDERIVYWLVRQNEGWAALEAARAAGEPPPDLLPHPDDIEVCPQNGVTFVGPVEEIGRASMLDTIALRDVLIMQDILDTRSTERHDGSKVVEPGGALLTALYLQSAIPPRLRLSDHELVRRQWRYERLTKRQLLKDLHHAWRSIGHPKPRGFVFAERSKIIKRIKFVNEFVSAAASGEIDVEAISKGQFDDNLLEFLERNGIPIESFLEHNAAQSRSVGL